MNCRREAKRICLGLAVLFLVICMQGPAYGLADQRKGNGINVLFLMTDQQHHTAMSCAGHPLIRTPNIDRIAREGVRFELATCPTASCSPARASIITGLYPHTHGVVLNSYGKPGDGLKDEQFPNTETILHARGYVTKHRGKWHIGPKSDFACYEDTPYAGPGYKSWLNKNMPSKKSTPGKDKDQGDLRQVQMIPEVAKGKQCFIEAITNGMHVGVANIGKSNLPINCTPEAYMTRQINEMIEQNADRSWMITASWHPPHALWVAPEPYYSMFDRSKVKLPENLDICPDWLMKGFAKQLGTCMGPKGVREYLAIYCAQMAMIDHYVGQILNKIDELGLAERTLIIFTSDHGDMQGEHGMIGKNIPVFYDGVQRIPLLMRLPGKIKPGTVISEPVSLVDLMPTILDYTNVPCPKVQGSSLRPLIEGRAKNWRKYSFGERRNWDYKDLMLMIRGDRWKYVYRENGHHELFDLKNDPHENMNQYANPANRKIIRKLHSELLKWMKQTDDRSLTRMPEDPFKES